MERTKHDFEYQSGKSSRPLGESVDWTTAFSSRLEPLGIERLNAMQEAMLNTAAKGQDDLLLLAPPGSGKTLAFLLPALHVLEKSASAFPEDKPAFLVLSPSRELAMQTASVWKSLVPPRRAVCCCGGHLMADERRVLREEGPAVVVGTPGRIADLMEKNYLETRGIRLLIIDEFDKMLELGFREVMQQIMEGLPAVKRRWLVSATDSSEFPVFLQSGAVRLDFRPANEAVPEVKAQLQIYHVTSLIPDKLATLLALLAALAEKGDALPTMVFVNYREAVERVCHFLQKNRVPCSPFHGGMEQNLRERSLYRFRSGSTAILVATDLAARGLDIPEVRSVIHYHLPLQQEQFVHRNGRSTRGNHPVGTAYWISAPQEKLPSYLLPTDYAEQPISRVKGFLPEGMDESGAVPPLTLARRIPIPKRATIYIGKGKKDKISRADIVGFLCKKGGLKGSDIGLIEVRDHHSYAAVPRQRVKEVLSLLQQEKIKGQRTLVEEAR